TEQFTRDFPRDARGWSVRAHLRGDAGDLAGALEDLRRAIQLDPSTAAYHNNLGVVLVQMEKFREAAPEFARAYELDPLPRDAACFTALAYSRAGLQHQSAAWLRTCLEKQLVNPARALADPNLSGLRSSPDWRSIEPLLRGMPAGR